MILHYYLLLSVEIILTAQVLVSIFKLSLTTTLLGSVDDIYWIRVVYVLIVYLLYF